MAEIKWHDWREAGRNTERCDACGWEVTTQHSGRQVWTRGEHEKHWGAPSNPDCSANPLGRGPGFSESGAATERRAAAMEAWIREDPITLEWAAREMRALRDNPDYQRTINSAFDVIAEQRHWALAVLDAGSNPDRTLWVGEKGRLLTEKAPTGMIEALAVTQVHATPYLWTNEMKNAALALKVPEIDITWDICRDTCRQATGSMNTWASPTPTTCGRRSIPRSP